MARTPSTAIESWEQLQGRIASIVERLNADRNLAIAAGANPFLALEELGYHVVPEARLEIGDRLRFSAKVCAGRRRLRKVIFDEVGRSFDLESAEELHRALFVDLSITPYSDERGCMPELPSTHPVSRRLGGDPAPDPLAVLRGRHPVIEPLLEYRSLDASRPRFAPPSAYRGIRRGEGTTSIRNVRIRLKGGQGTEGRELVKPPPRSRAPRGPASGSVIDINTASASELEVLPGIRATLAALIVAYRGEHGGFESPDALSQVPGISGQLMTKLRPHIKTES